MIALDNDEMSAVMSAARPLEPRARTEFLQAVAAELEQHRQRPGVVYRACRDLQRRFFDPPQFHGASKYD
jgi:hypothetical protein